jgi:hypothetical protein
MVTQNEVPFLLLLIIMVLEDLQLTSFSWRPDLFEPGSAFANIQYIFNPIYYLVKTITAITYIASFVAFIVLTAVMIYCASGLSKGRLKVHHSGH